MIPEDILNRVGRFTLGRSRSIEKPDFWGMVMSKMLVMRCEFHFPAYMFEYEAASPLFEHIEDGEIPPWYEIKQDEFNDITATKIEDKR